jgi:hypothetical protein
MITKFIEKISSRKKSRGIKLDIGEVESAIKSKKEIAIQPNVGGSMGFMGTSGYLGSRGFAGDLGTSGPGRIQTVTIEEYREHEYPPSDSFSSYPAVMFHTTEWINNNHLVPIGKSRYTGYPIYRYTGEGTASLNVTGHNWEELI